MRIPDQTTTRALDASKQFGDLYVASALRGLDRTNPNALSPMTMWLSREMLRTVLNFRSRLSTSEKNRVIRLQRIGMIVIGIGTILILAEILIGCAIIPRQCAAPAIPIVSIQLRRYVLATIARVSASEGTLACKSARRGKHLFNRMHLCANDNDALMSSVAIGAFDEAAIVPDESCSTTGRDVDIHPVLIDRSFDEIEDATSILARLSDDSKRSPET